MSLLQNSDSQAGGKTAVLSHILSALAAVFALIIIAGYIWFFVNDGYAPTLNQSLAKITDNNLEYFYRDESDELLRYYKLKSLDLDRYCRENGLQCTISRADVIEFDNSNGDERYIPVTRIASIYRSDSSKDEGYDFNPGADTKDKNFLVQYVVTMHIFRDNLRFSRLLTAMYDLRFAVFFVVVFLILAAFHLVVPVLKVFFRIPLWIRALAVSAGLLLWEYISLAGAENLPDDFMRGWAISRLILALVAVYYLVSMLRLLSSMRRIADGDVDSKTDLRYKLGYFEETGNILNNISDGMSKAVADRTKSEKLKTELIANVSHDLKTPLTSIINYSDLIGREETDNKNIIKYSDVLHRQSTRLKRLIDDLIEASKAGSGNIEVNPEPFDLNILLAQMVGEYKDSLTEKGLELVVSQPEEELIIYADGRHLSRVIDNLMNNIRKYALEGTRVYIDLASRDEAVTLSFKNISKYQLNISADELMERFTRGDRSRHTEGSGLGLNIAKSLTELMGGRMDTVIDGDNFRVTLEFNKMA